MRVTDGMLSNTIVTDLQNAEWQAMRTQTVLATGQRIQQPADDPGGTAVALQLQANVAEMKQYQANVQTGTAWMQATDTALGNAIGAVQQVSSLVVQAAGGTEPPNALAAIAAQVQQLQGQLLQTANSQYQGLYLFGGDATTTAPVSSSYTLNPAATGNRQVEIGRGAYATINVQAGAAFGSGSGSLFATLSNILNDLNGTSGGTLADLTNQLANLQSGLNALTDQQSQSGATLQRLSSANTSMQSLITGIQQQLAGVTGADVAKTIVEFQQQENTYQMALSAAAQLIQPSLASFLQ